MLRSGLITSVLLVFVNVGVSTGALEMHGHIQSPLFPNPYPANLHKQWDLEVPTGYKLHISFNYLDIEPSVNCFYDYLMVLHGRKILNIFCGRNSTDPHHPANKPIISPSNHLKLVFVTDETNLKSHLGFSAFFQAFDIDECSSTSLEGPDSLCSQICLNTLGSYLCTCYHGYHLQGDQRTCVLDCGGGVFKELEGVLSSPGYPKRAPHGQNCIYTISVPPGFQITLNFSDNFQIEHIQHQQPVCLFHWLKVSVPGETPKKFCGDKSPGIIPTNSHLVDLEFHTDGAGESRGFSLQYTTRTHNRTNRVECKLERQITNGKITPNVPRFFSKDYINIHCDTGYKLIRDGNEIDSFKTMCQENGTWHLFFPQCQMVNCGIPEFSETDLMELTETPPSTLFSQKITVKCSLEFYQLAGNAEFTCNAAGEWVSGDGQTFYQNEPQCVPVCGVTKQSSAGGRVFGGEKATLGQIPWQLFVKAPNRASASLINDRWALTAAHVVKMQKHLVFYGGMVDSSDKNKITMETEKIIVHPGYQETNFNNDIALVKMTSRVPLSENLRPVCLPEIKTNGPVMEGKMGTVSGFGAVNKNQLISKFLLYGHIKEYSERPCFRTDLEITENMFCAGNDNERVDSCKGDAGSPLVIPLVGVGSPDMPYQLKGIVSWGPEQCGNEDFKGYYTKVENYLDWIRETIKNN